MLYVRRILDGKGGTTEERWFSDNGGGCVQADRLLRNKVFVRKILNFMDRQTYTTASQGSQRESRSQAKRQHSREIGAYMAEEAYTHSSWR